MPIHIPENFFFGASSVKLKNWNKEDVGVIFSKTPAKAVGVFTTNKFLAAPVIVDKRNINNHIHFIIANSGIANACTGEKGIEDTYKIIKYVADKYKVSEKSILPSSTGIIGKRLPVEKIIKGIDNIKLGSSIESVKSFARSIMTTDTFPKIASKRFSYRGKKYSILGFAKGAGMIYPNMATMLSFILTDANLKKDEMRKMLKRSVEKSFNSITVDGDMSTNDTVILLSNGKNECVPSRIFYKYLEEIMIELAKMIVKDGEGATKFITINILNAPSKRLAKEIAMKVANSNLFKTAMFGEDANWGRIVSAIGSHKGKFYPEKIELFIGPYKLFQNMVPLNFDEKQVSKYLKNKEIEITIDMHQGKSKSTVWTCDLSYDYVKINADYRT